MTNIKLQIRLFLVSLLLFFIIVTLFIKKDAKITLLDNDLNYTAYSFVEKDQILNKIDQENSNYDEINIYLQNDDFSEYNIESQLGEIYKSYNLFLKDSKLIPFGRKVKLRFEAIKSNTNEEVIVYKWLDYKAQIEILDFNDNKVINPFTYTISKDDDLNHFLNFKGQEIIFDNQIKDIPLTVTHNINQNKNGVYILKLLNKDLNFEKEVEIIIENQEKIIPKEVVATKLPVEKNPLKPLSGTYKNDKILVDNFDKIDVLVNKQYYLSPDAVPKLKNIPGAFAVNNNFRAHPLAVDNFINMAKAMEKETGMKVLVTSAYRSYEYQNTLFNNYASRDGIEAANKYSAKAGESEHQTGLALDLVKPGVSMVDFGFTKEYIWISENASKYGFIVRYPQGKEHITGYLYEPWHLRYLGVNLANQVKDSGLTYDEYWLAFLK